MQEERSSGHALPSSARSRLKPILDKNQTGMHNLDFSFCKGAQSADPEATHGA
jgi:hypothetical protein